MWFKRRLVCASRLVIVNSANAVVSLVWERAYQTNPTPPFNVWVTEDMTKQLFWINGGGKNYDTFPNFQPLSAWANGYVVSAHTSACPPPQNPWIARWISRPILSSLTVQRTSIHNCRVILLKCLQLLCPCAKCNNTQDTTRDTQVRID